MESNLTAKELQPLGDEAFNKLWQQKQMCDTINNFLDRKIYELPIIVKEYMIYGK